MFPRQNPAIGRTADDVDPARRAVAVALLAGAAGVSLPVAAQLFGRVPRKLPPGRSVYSVRGSVTVDDRAADIDTVIRPGATVVTGAGAEIIFAVDADAHIVRENTRLELEKPDDAAGPLRLLTGALLSVFGRGEQRISTTVATIGIRGTGIYVESEPDRSYVCTCYGTADLRPQDEPSVSETVVSEHHDAPRYILAAGAAGERIRTAPFKDHSDYELALIEALVGRSVPFSFTEGYDSPFDPY